MTNRGFTLLEILVSLVVLATGMVLVMQMTNVAAKHSERVEEETIVQLACENMMNSILAGHLTATVGISTPIPDAPGWETTVELLDGPIEKVIAIRITAQYYQTDYFPSPINPGEVLESKTPDLSRRYVIKEWARRAEIKTRVVSTDDSGRATAVDGTGETVRADLNTTNGLGGGDFGSLDQTPELDPFAAIDDSFGTRNATGRASPTTERGTGAFGSSLGGGLN